MWKDAWPFTEEQLRHKLGHLSGQSLLLHTIFEKSRLLDIFRNFTVFEEEDNKIVKKVCRYQQYRAVNKTLQKLKKREGGVIRHTQSLDHLFDNYFSEYDDQQKSAIRQKYGTEKSVMSAKKRIEMICTDIVKHYKEDVIKGMRKTIKRKLRDIHSEDLEIKATAIINLLRKFMEKSLTFGKTLIRYQLTRKQLKLLQITVHPNKKIQVGAPL